MEAEQLLDALVRLCQVSVRDDLLYITERDKTNFPWIAEQLKTRRVELGQLARKVVRSATSDKVENDRETLSHGRKREKGK
jgi:hypothetical protein